MNHDLLRHPSGYLVLCPETLSGQFLDKNPDYMIVAIRLDESAYKTPYGEIDAVVE